jgi:hypothetical protein
MLYHFLYEDIVYRCLKLKCIIEKNEEYHITLKDIFIAERLQTLVEEPIMLIAAFVKFLRIAMDDDYYLMYTNLEDYLHPRFLNSQGEFIINMSYSEQRKIASYFGLEGKGTLRPILTYLMSYFYVLKILDCPELFDNCLNIPFINLLLSNQIRVYIQHNI